MKPIPSPIISKRLAQYGALSLAMMGITDANGQIVYTDVDPDVGAVNSIYNLFIGGDFEFGLIQDSNGGNNHLRIGKVASNAVMASASGLIYASALEYSDPISSLQSWWQNPASVQAVLNYSSCKYITPQWCGVTDKYLGLRFLISGETHYGWARLDVPSSPSTWVIKDYAYNPVADESILAGEGGTLGVDDNNFNNVKIVALNKSIGLYNLTGKTNYNLFSITGQSVLKGSIEADTYVVEANTVATGVYIMELKDANTNEVIRKKVVL